MLELPLGLPDLVQAATERVCVYQRVRYYAQSTEESATILTGAVAISILPVLYALLGAGAYVLAVVGLFNFAQGVSVSPLPIAFWWDMRWMSSIRFWKA